MPDRPGVDDDPSLARLIALWRDGLEDLRSRFVVVERDIARAVAAGGGDGNVAARLRAESRRLRALEGTGAAITDDLVRSTDRWLSGSGLRTAYAGGAGRAPFPFEFTIPHRQAVEVLSRDLFEDVLTATRFVDDDTKAAVRQLGRQLTGFSLTGGETPIQAARRLRRELAPTFGRAGTVQYADGSRRGLGHYTEMLLRTKTAQAHNLGTLNHSRAFGVEVFEILDGAECFAAETELAGLGGLSAVARQYVRGKRMRRVRAGGVSLAVGLHHPMLTPTGFVEAGDLRPGDHLAGGVDRDDPVALALLDLQHRPATAEQVFESSGQVPVRRPATANDLHGDAEVGDAEIEVVRTDRPLLNPSGVAELLQRLGYLPLMASDGQTPLVDRQGSALLLGRGSRPAGAGPVSVGDLGTPGVVAEVIPYLLVQIRRGTLLDPPVGQHALDPLPSDPHPLDDPGDGHKLVGVEADDLSGGRFVELAPSGEALVGAEAAGRARFGSELVAAGLASWHVVTSVEDVEYTGWVYDAESRSGLVSLNGIVARNCGLTEHTDPVRANGLIVTAQIAFSWPISHPHCRRALNPRPDLDASAIQLGGSAGGPLSDVSAPAALDQAQFERALEQQRQARTSRGRSGRGSRTGGRGSRSGGRSGGRTAPRRARTARQRPNTRPTRQAAATAPPRRSPAATAARAVRRPGRRSLSRVETQGFDRPDWGQRVGTYRNQVFEVDEGPIDASYAGRSPGGGAGPGVALVDDSGRLFYAEAIDTAPDAMEEALERLEQLRRADRRSLPDGVEGARSNMSLVGPARHSTAEFRVHANANSERVAHFNARVIDGTVVHENGHVVAQRVSQNAASGGTRRFESFKPVAGWSKAQRADEDHLKRLIKLGASFDGRVTGHHHPVLRHGFNPNASFGPRGVTPYGATKPVEDWAETWRLFLHSEQGIETPIGRGVIASYVDERGVEVGLRFRDMFPNRAAWIDEMMAEHGLTVPDP